MGESTPKRIGVAELRRKRKKRREWVGSYQENEMKRGLGGGGEGCKNKKPKKRKNKEEQWVRVHGVFFFFKKKEQKKRREKLRNGREFSEREVKELS